MPIYIYIDICVYNVDNKSCFDFFGSIIQNIFFVFSGMANSCKCLPLYTLYKSTVSAVGCIVKFIRAYFSAKRLFLWYLTRNTKRIVFVVFEKMYENVFRKHILYIALTLHILL